MWRRRRRRRRRSIAGYYKRARAHAQQTLAADAHRFYYYDFQTATLVPMPTPRRGEQMGPVVCVHTGFAPQMSAFYRAPTDRRPQCFRQRPTHRWFVVYFRSAPANDNHRPGHPYPSVYQYSGYRRRTTVPAHGHKWDVRGRGIPPFSACFYYPVVVFPVNGELACSRLLYWFCVSFFFFFCLQWQRPARSPRHTKPRPGSAWNVSWKTASTFRSIKTELKTSRNGSTRRCSPGKTAFYFVRPQVSRVVYYDQCSSARRTVNKRQEK